MNKFSIIDYLLKEARVDKWSLLQEMQLTNMVNQFAGKNHVKGEEKQPYFEIAQNLNENIIKKLKIDFKTEKLMLLWLLDQIFKKQFRAKEDDEIVKKNLDLYFSNRKDIDKNIFQIDYNTLKDEIDPWQVGGEERKFLEFLSNPIAQGGKLKVYKITEVDTCLKIGPGTSWCIQGESWAKTYLAAGPLFLITKNNKRYALISFAKNMWMDTKDVWLTPQVIKEIRDVLPDDVLALTNDFKWKKNPSKEEIAEALKKDYNNFGYIENPDKEIQLIAVKQRPDLIQHIKNPDKELQLIAVNHNGNLIQHFIDTADDEVKKDAVTNSPGSIQYIKNPSKELQLIAVGKDGKLLKSFANTADRDVQMMALQHGARLKWITNPDKEMQLTAITADPDQLEGMQNPDKDVQLAAVNSEVSSISFIKDPDIEVQMAAVKKFKEQYPVFMSRPETMIKHLKKWIKEIHPDVLKYIKGK